MLIPAYTPEQRSPQQAYSEQLQHGVLEEDSAQRTVIAALQKLHQQLLTPKPTLSPSLSDRIFFRNTAATDNLPKGLYIWGGVGRGKTWLMDIFFNSLSFKQKQRLHFHHFMQTIHNELRELRGQRDPLKIVASNLARRTKILCLDELYVSDIGDAMLLGQLLENIFQQGIVLVTTTNIPPDHLYQDGLQRMAFLPTIALIKEHMQIVELSGNTDYRLKYLESAKVYHTPLTQSTNKLLQEEFEHLTTSEIKTGNAIAIKGREIPVLSQTDEMIWFDFAMLCNSPRSSADYIEIARQFHTVVISNIPVMTDEHNDQVRRFMTLIDELYDCNVKVIMSAEDMPNKLYQGSQLAFAYQRTASRLQEMQSRAYLAKRHRF